MSQIIIGVDVQPDIDEYFSIQAQISAVTIVTLDLIFKASRLATGQCAIGSSTNQTANNIRNALNTDYNNTSLFTITRVADTVTVTANNPEMTFLLGTNTAAPDVSTTIINDAVTPFTIDDIVASEAPSNPCDNVQLSIECSEQADSISSPISAVVGSNPYIASIVRSNALITVSMVKDGETASKTVLCPKLLAAYFTVETNTNFNALGEATVIVQQGVFSSVLADYNPINLEYSLNGVDWQSSTIFPDLEQGDYTLYIRDGLGCQVTLDFTIDEFSPNLVDYDSIAEISLTNALTFKKNETINGCSIFSNPENSLSHHERSNYNHRNYKQYFQQCDTIVRTQCRTNHDTVTAKLVDCEGVETPLTVTKVTDNMNKTDVRDVAVMYRYGTWQVWVTFIGGNTYDPDTLVANGTYFTGGTAPSFVNVGDYIYLQGTGWVQLLEIETGFLNPPGYNLVMYKTSAITAPNFYSLFEQVQATSVYNNVNFERYEFGVDLTALDGDYYVQVDMTDATFDDAQFISEWFNVSEEIDERHHVLEYYNSINNEINYATGIQYKLRLFNLDLLEYSPELDQDIYVTDTNTILGENVGREFFKMALMPVPTNIARKIARALYHDRLKIDGITYLLNGVPEIKRMVNTNMYLIKATLVKSEYVFKNERGISLEEVLLQSGDPLNIDANSQGLLIVN